MCNNNIFFDQTLCAVETDPPGEGGGHGTGGTGGSGGSGGSGTGVRQAF